MVRVVVIKETLARMMKQEGVVGYVIVKRSAGNYSVLSCLAWTLLRDPSQHLPLPPA